MSKGKEALMGGAALGLLGLVAAYAGKKPKKRQPSRERSLIPVAGLGLRSSGRRASHTRTGTRIMYTT